jgi:hypothetical protein
MLHIPPPAKHRLRLPIVRHNTSSDRKSLLTSLKFDGVAKTHQLLRCCNCSRCFDVRKYASLLDNRAPCIWRFLLSHRH